MAGAAAGKCGATIATTAVIIPATRTGAVVIVPTKTNAPSNVAISLLTLPPGLGCGGHVNSKPTINRPGDRAASGAVHNFVTDAPVAGAGIERYKKTMSTQTKPEQDKATSGPLDDLIYLTANHVSSQVLEKALAELAALKDLEQTIKLVVGEGIIDSYLIEQKLATLAALRKEQP